MVVPLRRLWKPVASSEAVEGGVKAARAVFKLAETLNEQQNNNPQIKKLVERIPTLLEALNSPIGKVVNDALPFVSLATGLIKFTFDITKEEPTIAQTVAIVTQAAYLESIRETLKSNSIFTQDESEASTVVKKQIRELGDLEIDDKEARLALVHFHESKLAQAFNEVLSARLQEVLSARLQETGIAESEVQTWVEKVAINTAQYIHPALAEGGDGVQRLLDWYSSGGREEFEKYFSIDTYLEEKIKPLPKQRVFNEEFSFKDIYVPLKAIPLDNNGKEISNADEFVLEEWSKKTIIDPEKQDKVIFIQAGPGRGKTVFCRMFADWVRQNLHPLLTPILIRLRDIEHFDRPIEEILRSALGGHYFVCGYPGWLADCKTQYLFLLDGFDELRMEGRASGGIERFIRQVGQFQRDFSGKETGHRVILTGRPLALQGISFLPDNFERVKLLEMNDGLRAEWLEKWQQVIIPDNPDAAKEETEKFKGFLEADNCPKGIKQELAREPLLSYLLAKLHKEEEIKQEDFEQASDSTQAKILIYQKSLDWVLRRQRNELLLYNIIGLNIDSLERILTEAGLCVVQSGGQYAKVKMIETRLARDDSDAAQIIRELRDNRGRKALTTALGAFYLRPAPGEMEGGVEFYHKSFSEFLCAKRLQASLEEWTKKDSKRPKWLIDDEQLWQQIYDLLGYGGLTPEIVEYLWGLLTNSEEFRPVKLFQRLSDFYQLWCDGKFIDALPHNNYPQKTMLELKEQLPERETYLGLKQVDVYAGLNIMILLLELHRYGQSQTVDLKQRLTFYPCGQPRANDKPKEPTLLLRLIGYSTCIGIKGFRDTVGNFLKGANLGGANLEGANLEGANLGGAFLRGVNLVRANLCGANLGGAFLEDANLGGAFLEDANLGGAFLEDADLVRANLHSVNLVRANLVRANLRGAKLRGADLHDADLEDAKIGGANLRDANLRGADLGGANLGGAFFVHANLRGADLGGANLGGANLCGADLRGANLEDAKLEDAKLSDKKWGDVRWDENTIWTCEQLGTAINVPEALESVCQLR